MKTKILRHGQRTINNPYPNDPYKDKIHWPEGFAQLTNLGKKQEYELGNFLRRRYGRFLGSYSSEKVSILSSAFDRTINSANLVLAALFPIAENQIWNEDLLWNPIAVKSLPRTVDYLIQSDVGCAKYSKAREEYDDSPKVKALKEQHQQLFDYLEENSGLPVRTIENVRDLYETIEIEHNSNKT